MIVGMVAAKAIEMVTRRGGVLGEGYNPIVGGGDMLDAFGGTFANPAAKEAMSGLAERGKSIAGNVLGTVLPSYGLLTGQGPLQLGADMINLIGDVEKWGQSLRKTTEHLTAFNGTLAFSHLEFERRGMVRNIESGQRIGGKSAGMHEALSDLLDEMQPLRDAVTNVTNVVLTKILELMTGVVETGTKMLSYADEAAAIVPGGLPRMVTQYLVRKIQEMAEGEETTTDTPFIMLMKHFQDGAEGRVDRPNAPGGRGGANGDWGGGGGGGGGGANGGR